MCNREFSSKQLNKIKNRIKTAALRAHRDPADINLIAASKQQSSSKVRDFNAAGLTQFGENYLQEALHKQQNLASCKINWHFIGQIQSNKCKAIAQNFSWVHTVDRLKIAERLARFRLEHETLSNHPLNILLQINIDQEASKAGISVDSAAMLCNKISELKGINLRGFMLIPQRRLNYEQQKRPFALARSTLELINQQQGLNLDTLSMGMSADLEAAISEGATMIRVGTDLFGPRG